MAGIDDIFANVGSSPTAQIGLQLLAGQDLGTATSQGMQAARQGASQMREDAQRKILSEAFSHLGSKGVDLTDPNAMKSFSDFATSKGLDAGIALDVLSNLQNIQGRQASTELAQKQFGLESQLGEQKLLGGQLDIARKLLEQQQQQKRIEALASMRDGDNLDALMTPEQRINEAVALRKLKQEQGVRQEFDVMKEDRQRVKEAEKLKKSANVHGFKLREDAIPSSDDIKSFKNIVANKAQLDAVYKRFDDLLEDVGTESFNIVGADKKKLEGYRDQMIVIYNKIAELGALSKDDKEILQSQIPDPTAFWTSGGTVRDQLKNFMDSVSDVVDATGRVRGFEPAETKRKVIKFGDL